MWDSGRSREDIKLNEESFFHFSSKHVSIVGRHMLSKYSPITSQSPALSTPTIVFKAKETPVLPQATTTHPLYGRNRFQLPQKCIHCQWNLLPGLPHTCSGGSWAYLLLQSFPKPEAWNIFARKWQKSNQLTNHTLTQLCQPGEQSLLAARSVLQGSYCHCIRGDRGRLHTCPPCTSGEWQIREWGPEPHG